MILSGGLRIALFGSGSPQSLSAFQRLRRREMVAVVVPPAAFAKPLADAARHERLEVIEFGPDVASRLQTLSVDLICIASFPYMLRGPLLGFRAINMHMSLLPRHRGADPIFWTYYCADAETGVTVHWIDAEWDSGDIVAQRSVPVAPAKPSRELYFELAEIGGELLHHTLDAIQDGTASRTPQDESRATRDPAPKPESVRADFAGWPVARAWHFLAGMSDQRSDLVVDANGVVHRHGRAIGWREGIARVPGSIVETGRTVEVHCRDGVVTLERAQRSLLRALVRRLRRV